MQKIAFFFAFLLLCIFLCTHCKKTPEAAPTEPLPPKTIKGANTFGCLVNEQTFISCCEIWGCDPLKNSQARPYYISVDTTQTPIKIYISAEDMCNDSVKSLDLSLLFEVNRITKEARCLDGRYYTNAPGDYFCGGTIATFDKLDTLNPANVIKISKLDLSGGIVSGVFAFDLYEPNCTDTIHIREGRFDYKIPK